MHDFDATFDALTNANVGTFLGGDDGVPFAEVSVFDGLVDHLWL